MSFLSNPSFRLTTSYILPDPNGFDDVDESLQSGYIRFCGSPWLSNTISYEKYFPLLTLNDITNSKLNHLTYNTQIGF